MRLELRYRSDIDLSQPAMQVEIRNHIARCLRDDGPPFPADGALLHPAGKKSKLTDAAITAREQADERAEAA